MDRRNRSPEENERRAKIRELLHMGGISSMDDIQNLFKETISEFMENGLDAELDDELGYSKYDYKNKDTDNSRNGHSSKTLRTRFGDVDVSVPRDRKGEFEPQVLKKNQTSVSQDIEEKILNTALTTLYCGGNQLTVLDVSNNAGLENLGCNNNQLTVLDVSNNTKLTQLICSANLFTTLDMSKNTAVNILTCYYNPNLKKVTISNSDLTKYVFTGCSSLTTMVLTSTTVPSINAKQFDEFTNLNFYVKDGKYSYVTSADNGSTIVNAYKTATNWSTYADRIYPYLPKTVTAAKIATLYLPYEVAILEGIKAYYCAGISNGKMQLTQFADGVIPAGTPAILTSDAATVA